MKILLLMSTIFLVSLASQAQTRADSTAVLKAASDYIEGWYQGDTARMRNALHKDLAKRTVAKDPESKGEIIKNLGVSKLIQIAGTGKGKNSPNKDKKRTVKIYDIHENMATVKALSGDYVDYLHMARVNGKWKIINVLWQRL